MPCKAHLANNGSMLGTLCSTAGSRPRLSGVENMAGYSEWIKGSKVPHPVCLIISLAMAANVATPFGTLIAYIRQKSSFSLAAGPTCTAANHGEPKKPSWMLLQLLQDCRDLVEALSATQSGGTS